MSRHIASIAWKREGAPFTDNRYSRRHRWSFDGGIEVPASSSPHSVPIPLSSEEAVDPEEAFVASLSSCHMLWFLSLAASRGFVVDSYRDDAIGLLSENAEGKRSMTQVTLRPRVTFVGEARPTAAQHESLHDEAHERCFLARSVNSDVRCEAEDVTE
jgi:organic hydroperoxide reductase OsmC/OhrA